MNNLLVRIKNILFKKPYNGLVEGAIYILLEIKGKIADNSNLDCVAYQNAKDLREDIDKYVINLKSDKPNLDLFDEMYSHFLPTSTFQEHSMANGWTKEYLKLSERFDNIYEDMKFYLK